MPTPRRAPLPYALLAAALLVNPWTLAAVLTSDGRIDDGLLRFLLAAVALVFLVLGLVILVRNRLIPRRRLLFAGATLVLAVLVVEIVLHLIGWLFGTEPDPAGYRMKLSVYRDEPWAREMLTDLNGDLLARAYRFHPLLGWDAIPFRSRFINIDERGVRAGWNPEPAGEGRPRRLWIFGGSTAWGFGARDEHTIPSELSRLLHEAGRSLDVVNYGDMAYVSKQEVMNLILLLREGRRPDYVVLYDGANDVMAALQAKRPGALYDMGRGELEKQAGLTPGQRLWSGFRGLVEEHSKIYEAVEKIPGVLGGGESHRRRSKALPEPRIKALAAGIAEEYVRTLELVSALSRQYGFRFLAVWQPVLCAERTVLDEEKTLPRYDDPTLEPLHAAVRRELAARAPEGFVDLTDALAGREETCYIDYCHLSEGGNRRVARRLLDLAVSRLGIR